MSAPPPPPPNVTSAIAPILLGTLFNWCLYGVLVVQVYLYDFYFPSDKRMFKMLVYFVFFIESLQTAFTGADLYYWLASGFGNFARLEKPYLSSFDTPFMGSLVALIIQSFFCYRIWVLKRSFSGLALVIGLVSFTEGVAGMTLGIYGHTVANFAEAHKHTLTVLIYITLIGDVIADLMIAITMTCLLSETRKQEHQYSKNAISRILRLTVETNVLSASVAIIALVAYIAAPSQTYYFCPTAVIGKIYSNTLLVMFNNRIILRDIPHSMGSDSANSYPLKTTTSHIVPIIHNSAAFAESTFKSESPSHAGARVASNLNLGTIHVGGVPGIAFTS
ncbi:hypothetical protein BV25DRAFT_1829454 [Artomyces pyxidatus]|uniref:Uncharacterized protein n=1 Tax=Artomyces pyxidatus TaxID=48021 RepID=A0ACB8SSK3_9AGAM|nr:hypothetical protein BV25DRAFT_1829454 [Artomyces pyxidatus]